jgi:hypothetical protein
MQQLIDMLRYKRPEGSHAQRLFCQKFLEPVFGYADPDGNYIHIVSNGTDYPKLCFTAHHDTVHRTTGLQEVVVKGDVASAPNSDCLGADCTTGVWLILKMIEANIPGVYVVHAGEEIGCKGSRALVESKPRWMDYLKAVISFDRKGTESIITHQLGDRTASDAFAVSLAEALMLPMRPDNTGSFTDSSEYAGIVSECTNISVGYYDQHTKNETQDLYFAQQLCESLISADWDSLVFERDPSVVDRLWSNQKYGIDDYDDWAYPYHIKGSSNVAQIEELVYNYPEDVAAVLDDWGVSSEDLFEHLKAIRGFVSNKVAR